MKGHGLPGDPFKVFMDIAREIFILIGTEHAPCGTRIFQERKESLQVLKIDGLLGNGFKTSNAHGAFLMCIADNRGTIPQPLPNFIRINVVGEQFRNVRIHLGGVIRYWIRQE